MVFWTDGAANSRSVWLGWLCRHSRSGIRNPVPSLGTFIPGFGNRKSQGKRLQLSRTRARIERNYNWKNREDMNARILGPVFSAMILAAILTQASEKDVINQSFNVKPGGNLYIKVDRGNIHINTSDSDKVDVKVVRELKRASDARAREVYEMHKIDISQAGDTMKVEAENTSKIWNKNPFNNLDVDYTISIPRRFNVDLHTSGGNIDIAEVEGSTKAHTSGGNIALEGGKGNAEIRTSDGNLRLGNLEGDLIAHTSGGHIEVDRITGSAEVETSGGHISVKEANGAVSAHTSGGNVSARLNEQPKSKCLLKTSGGNISVSLAEKVAVDLTARTSGGRVESDFDGEFNKSRTKLVAHINGGGPELLLETSGGNVEIRK